MTQAITSTITVTAVLQGAVWSCAINDTALLAATGSADFTACLWDPISGERKTQLQHKHIVRTINFSHHTDKLLTGGMEKLIRIFDCNQPEAEPTVIQGAVSNIRCSAWIQSDNLILTSYLDKPNIRCAAAGAAAGCQGSSRVLHRPGCGWAGVRTPRGLLGRVL